MKTPRFLVLLFIVLFVFQIQTDSFAQTYTMTNGTVSTCSGTFLDPGGNGNYGNNLNITESFCSNSGNCISVNFTSFRTQGGNDILTIYDGPSTASPLIGTFSGTTSPGLITSSTGCLTFRFVTNGSTVRSGWTANISCGTCGTNYLMDNTPVTSCSGLFYDSGGPGSNYGNNQNFTKTFCSATAGNCLKIEFVSFALSFGDNLSVYDGNNITSPLIGTYSGTTLPPVMLASNGCLTVRFTSNGFGVAAGWQAIVSCEVCPTPPSGTATYTHPTVGLQNTYVGANMVSTCGGTYTDNGGTLGNYSNNIGTNSIFGTQGVYRTFCPDQAGNCVRVQFSSFYTELYSDYLVIRNGPTQNSPALDSWWGGPLNSYAACMGAGMGPYTSTDQSGCLTFEFFSDNSVSMPGWVATIDCVPCVNGPNGTDNSDCAIATPVCSDQSFTDASTGPGIISDGGNGCVLSENFSNWYKIKIMTGGTLGLHIVPNVTADDYDFALYQSKNCGTLGSPVRCSYASNTGNTGMDNALNLSVSTEVCGWPNSGSDVDEDVCGNGWVNELAVTAGQTFYLLVNKWTPAGSGFTVDWVLGGGASLNCSVLPVELVSFDAIPENGMVKLRWTTASEINNDYFTVERSANGKTFLPVQIVDGSGNTTTLRNYETVDAEPLKGLSYYRLKQTDFDGMYSYSDPVAVDFREEAVVFYLVPNPAGDETDVIFNAGHSESFSLQLLNAQGRPLLNEIVKANDGINTYRLNLGEISSGVYLVVLSNEKSIRKTRLIIE